MRSSTGTWLIVIVAITILSLFMILTNPTIGDRQVVVRLGLDIQGGSRVLLAPDDPNVDPASVDQARQIISQRVNGLGVTEPLVQVVGGNRIVVELPDIKDPKAAVDLVQHTGLLEFVDFAPTGTCSASMPTAGQYILTDKQQAVKATAPAAQGTAAATAAAVPTSTQVATEASTAAAGATAQAAAQGTAAATPAATAQATPPVPATGDGSQAHPLLNPCTTVPFHTVMTGAGLQTAQAGIDSTKNQWVVNFTLASNQEATDFDTHTKTHINQQMAIVLDGQVLSAPVIQSELSTGGEITGSFTQTSAEDLALKLKYGALPVSLHVDSSETVGASLGQASIQASVIAGIIGIAVVLVFMVASYGIPGIAADLALLLFAAINFALYKFIPVTLTLPALVGFMISVGTAVDGNILIFERIKEELRAGRVGEKAIDLGFSRAWPSIRDSNLSTLIVAAIVYFFGGQFGAGTVRGFALTLALGLIINLFTAIVVTRTFLNVIMAISPENSRRRALFMRVVQAPALPAKSEGEE